MIASDIPIYIAVFHNGFGNADISLHTSYEDAGKAIVNILKRPENYSRLPENLKGNLETWEQIGENIFLLTVLNDRWIIDIEVKYLTSPTDDSVVDYLRIAQSALQMADIGSYKITTDQEYLEVKRFAEEMMSTCCSFFHSFMENMKRNEQQKKKYVVHPESEAAAPEIK